MTPAEQLAAARERVVGPHLPAREEWLRGWASSVMWRVSPNTDVLETAIATGFVFNGRAELRLTNGTTMQRPDRIRLDVHRPEVRDHLVRLGCPEWERDVPAAVWCWGMTGKAPRMVLRAWDDAWAPRMDRWSASPVNGACISTMVPDRTVALEDWAGWMFRLPANSPSSGPETGDEGRACADVAALNAGCILRVEGGWLVPLPDGGIGFFEEVSRDE